MLSSCMHVAADGKISLFYGRAAFRCMCIPPLLCPSVDGHLGCFHILATLNNAAMNFEMHVSLKN